MLNMTFTTVKNTIQIGDSAGVILPAKEFKRMGLKVGDPVKITFEPAEHQDSLVDEYEAFKKQYGETLKNLANR